jgi:predicted ATPase
MIRTPDQRLRVFVSSTLAELATERAAVRAAIERLRLSPVMFEIGARPHPPRELYRAYLDQSDVFVGIYWQRYGWIAPGEEISGLEDELRLAGRLPQLIYIKEPAPEREPGLTALLQQVQQQDRSSYRRFATPEELEDLVGQDLAVLLSERFEQGRGDSGRGSQPTAVVPAPLTTTIGRDDEVAGVIGLLDGGCRLLTVTGPGGVGKTRLALVVGRTLAARPGSEVRFVPLAAVSDASLVLQVVADRVGAGAAVGISACDSLAAHFADRPAVLILDNFEQVVEAGPELVELLERTPGLQVLVTSRQALRLVGEHEVRLAPLALPDPDATAADIERVPSVQLLEARARAHGITWRPGPGDARALAKVCRLLGGLPLAIELVVARLRLLTPTQLLDRLGSVLDLPAAGEDLPSRQRNLRSTLAWSHDLLDEDERRLFAQFSVFAGGATLDAVEQVCLVDGDAVDTALAGLLDKSLLFIAEPTPGGDLRIRMLEPVREFAAERLLQSGEVEQVRVRHLDYFLRLGRQAQPFLCGPRQQEWAARMDDERGNLRTAFETALERRAFDTVLRMTWDTMVFYYIRDAVEEPRRRLLRLAEMASGLAETEQAMLDVGLVMVGESPGRQEPVRVLEGATQVFDRHGPPLEAAVSRHYLALHHWGASRHVQAIEVLEEASRGYVALEHDWGAANVQMTLGTIDVVGHRFESAEAHYRLSLQHSRRIDNRPQIAQALQGLALLSGLQGRVSQASDLLAEAGGLVMEDKSVTGATYCLEALAAIRLQQGDAMEAVRLIAVARSTRRRRHVPEWTAAADAADLVLAAARAEVSAEVFADRWRAGDQARVDVLALLAGGLQSSASGEDVPTATR